MRNLTGGELVSVYGGGYSWGYCPPPPCNYCGGGSKNKGSKNKGSKKKGSKNKGSKGR